ncbi:hypothetical protein HYZ99_04565 [Candidatus Peregrinibacteria bacterium]|nr:hypothetical protein [Candidatus Peregrinibacteria bacterium]
MPTHNIHPELAGVLHLSDDPKSALRNRVIRMVEAITLETAGNTLNKVQIARTMMDAVDRLHLEVPEDEITERRFLDRVRIALHAKSGDILSGGTKEEEPIEQLPPYARLPKRSS